jgi:hypothetical protein
MIQANFKITPSAGDVFATEFAVTNLTITTGSTVDRYVWNFGTKDYIYNTDNPSYIYNYPGVFTVSLTAVDYDNNLSTATQTVTATLPYRDYITFTQIPETFPNPGNLTKVPFKVSVLSCNYKAPLIVDLFATNSQSTPSQFITNKWNFLNPTWKFLDKNLNTVTSLSVEPTLVYKNNKVVAVSGTAEFFYVDSMSNGDPTTNIPIVIIASLQTFNFSNAADSNIYNYNSYTNSTTLQAGIIWQVNDLFPSFLKLTGNYLDNINPNQWVGIKIPVLITCHSQQSDFLPGGDETISEVIFSYPETNELGKTSTLELSVTNLSPNQYILEDEPLYFQTKDSNNNRTGGYIFTGITVLTAANNIAITAKTTGTTSKAAIPANSFIYPYGYSVNPGVWVSNPINNTLNKITLVPYPNTNNTINILKQNKTLLDGAIKEITIPGLSSTDTYNYSMSGFSGIYSISIDPRNGDAIACDSELDRIYRISTTGEILKTFELSSLESYNPRQKFFTSWSWLTPSPSLSSTRFAIYGPYLVNSSPQNYLTTVNGLLLPPVMTEVDEYERTLRLLYRLNNLPYPEEGLLVETTQIINPSLPKKYLDGLQFWSGRLQAPTSVLYLSGADPLLKDNNRYLVSLDGIIQIPTSYTVNPYLRTISFSQTLDRNTNYDVRFTPNLDRTNWIFTTTGAPVTSYSCEKQINYISTDPNIGFLVIIDGILQSQKTFKYLPEQKLITFNPPITGTRIVNIAQFFASEEINNKIAYTPTYASIDKDYNIWVSLFNSVSVLKFDKDFNFLFSVAPSGIKWESRVWVNNPTDLDFQSAQFGNKTRTIDDNTPYDSYTDEFFLKPPVVETDKNNDCWVSYANPLCCMLVKYGRLGNILTQIPLPPYTTPINISVTPNNNIWVANYNGSVYEYSAIAGSLQLYDTNTSTLLSSITGFARPSHLALDRNSNIWFTHGLKNLGYLDTKTGQLSTWQFELSGGFTPYTISSAVLLSGLETYGYDENIQDEYISGLAVDVYNRVWLIDGLQNNAWVLSATPNFDNFVKRKFKIRPNTTIEYITDIQTAGTTTLTGDYYYRSAQATGDWTGNRWFQKYAQTSQLSSMPVSGVSTQFNVTDFVNKNQIRRVNESFNTAEYYQSLALPETLASNTKLFNDFFASAVGTGYLSGNEDLGQTVYERIANFVKNHTDLETCNIDQLLSLADEVGVASSDYAASYPAEVRNMLDIASVAKSKLWGIKDQIPILDKSIGNLLDTKTYILTAGTKIILRNKLDNTLSLIQVPVHNDGRLVYPLLEFEDERFAKPVTVQYLFYDLDPQYTGNYIDNIIDWNSSFTTLNYNLSNSEDWLGHDGAIETVFRYFLTKNLFN